MRATNNSKEQTNGNVLYMATAHSGEKIDDPALSEPTRMREPR